MTDEAALLQLIDRMRPSGTLIGRRRGIEVVRLEDESGARLVVAFRRRVFHELLPSIAGDHIIRVTGVTRLNDEVHRAQIAGEDGSIPLALELEQGRLIRDDPIDGMASIVAFGNDVEFFSDAQAFSRSRASLIDPEGRDDGGPPPMAAELGCHGRHGWDRSHSSRTACLVGPGRRCLRAAERDRPRF